MKRKLLALVLAVVMCVSLLPVGAFAATTVANGTCGDGLTWVLDSDGTFTVSGTGEMADYDFSSVYEDHTPWRNYRSDIKRIVIGSGVKSIGKTAFFKCENLTDVTIGSGVQSIRDNAFDSCTKLPTVLIPDNVKTIGCLVFDRCSNLENVTIGSGVQSFGYGAFQNCTKLTSIVIPDNVKTMGWSAFEGCESLKSVTIGSGIQCISAWMFVDCTALKNVTYGSSVQEIGGAAFKGCKSLERFAFSSSVLSIGADIFEGCSSLISIDVSADNENYSSRDGVLFNKDKTALICCPPGKTGGYTIPYTVERLYSRAFNGDNITSLTIMSRLKKIGTYALYECNNLNDIYYMGTEEEWNRVDKGFVNTDGIEHSNQCLLTANIHCNYTHTHAYDYEVWEFEPNCSVGGYSVNFCICGDHYTDHITAPLGHDYDEDGICTRCGDEGPDYKEPSFISRLLDSIRNIFKNMFSWLPFC